MEHSCGGSEPCTCPLCLCLARIARVSYEPGRTETFRLTVLSRVRFLQSEILDLAELERHYLSSTGAPPPVEFYRPGASTSAAEGAPVAEGASAKPGGKSAEPRVREEENKRSERKKKRRKSESPASPRRDHKRELREKGSKESRKRSPSPAPRASGSGKKAKLSKSPQRVRDTPKKEDRKKDHKDSKSAEEREYTVEDKKRDRSSSSHRPIKTKAEPSQKERDKETVEDVRPLEETKEEEPSARTTLPKSAPRRRDREESEVIQRRYGGRGRGSNPPPSPSRPPRPRFPREERPRSPSRPPPTLPRWRGPSRGYRSNGNEAPRWGKNRGRAKFLRNAQIRHFGWEEFHASRR